MLARSPRALVVLLIGGLFAGGCGREDDDAAQEPRTEARVKLEQGVRIVGSEAFRRTVTVKQGDQVQFQTRVRSAGRAGAEPRVALTLDRNGESIRARVTQPAHPDVKAASAVIRTTRGRELELVDPRYVCRLPPATFCPLEVTMGTDGFELRFAPPPPEAPVTIVADIRVAR